MNVIFLDIDGVLNHLSFYNNVCKDESGNVDVIKMQQWREEHPYPLSEFDPIAVKRVAELIETTNSKLVISSSWRIGDNGRLKDIFAKIGLPTDFDVTPNFMFNFNASDTDSFIRGDEINEYLNSHPEIDNFVIIDDDNDMLEEQQKNFVLCDDKVGFTEDDKEKAIKILIG